jgi:UDP-N-acetylglucosamine 2-epimerase (non-hydrolysing)
MRGTRTWHRGTPRIVVVAGTRPNFVKIAPLMKHLRPPTQASADVLLVHTGQHYDEAMSRVFFDQLEIPKPDVNLEVGSSSHGRQCAEIMLRFEPLVEEWKPDLLVVVGDVNSTVACAMVASKLGIRVAHVEAGLRSFDRGMPEEINRVVTDAVSDYLFVTETSGLENLRREGIADDAVFFVGNVMIDSLRSCLPKARSSSTLRELGLVQDSRPNSDPPPFALLTLHRPSNADDPAKLVSILDVLEDVGRSLPVVFPAHPRTWHNIERFGFSDRIRSAPVTGPGIWTLPPVGYLESLHLMSAATFVLTDSGGIQEETTALGVPCLTLRENTERPVTVTEGTNTLVGGDPAAIRREVAAILSGNGKRGRIPKMWDGNAAHRIVTVLLEALRRDAPARHRVEVETHAEAMSRTFPPVIAR